MRGGDIKGKRKREEYRDERFREREGNMEKRD